MCFALQRASDSVEKRRPAVHWTGEEGRKKQRERPSLNLGEFESKSCRYMIDCVYVLSFGDGLLNSLQVHTDDAGP